MSDPEFGESGISEPRAEASVFVRRSLNEYTGLDEVFEFSYMEPTEDQGDREPYPMIKYYITRDHRSGRPGVKESEVSLTGIKRHSVPDEVLERAAAMIDYIEVEPDED